jgi:hypothetical protein
VGGSSIGAFESDAPRSVYLPGDQAPANALSKDFGGDSMTGSINSPRASNPAARTTGCLLDRACFAVLSCKLRFESSSSHLCECSSKLLAPSFSLPVLPSSDDTILQARPPSGQRREEDLERPVRRPRTTDPDVDAVPFDGPVVVLSDQVEERERGLRRI